MKEHIFLVITLFEFYPRSSCGNYLEDVCMQPMDEGHKCTTTDGRTFPSGEMHYFNTKYEECRRFHYNGCGGNSNRFSVQDDCIDACQVDWFITKDKKSRKKGTLEGNDSANPSNVDCDAPRNPGPCRALIKQWYYDGESNKCKEFYYGGCKGNGNRFNSEEQCENACMNT